jgi:hypothetical protein
MNASYSPLPKSRLKLAMSLLRSKGVVKEDLSGHLHLRQPDLTRDDLARLVRDYEERDARSARAAEARRHTPRRMAAAGVISSTTSATRTPRRPPAAIAIAAR